MKGAQLKRLIAEENLVINDKSVSKVGKQKALFQKFIWEKKLKELK